MHSSHSASIDLAVGREAYAAALDDLQTRRAVERLWSRDPTLWKADATNDVELSNRLGWLDLPDEFVTPEKLQPLDSLLTYVRQQGFRHVVVCGMGGSSLAPEVFRITFGARPGYPELIVLDFTDPTLIRLIDSRIDPAQTLFVIASKSGGTIEVMSFLAHFWELTRGDGGQFCAITDQGTSLARLAQERGFRQTFINPSEIGGRYSALSYFGLVPAALLGLDIRSMLEAARGEKQRCGPDRLPRDNSGAVLGAFMGGLARSGRDKLTLLASPRLNSFGLWVEQLIAESTGKDGKGIVPIVGEPFGTPDVYGSDRAFVALRLTGDDNSALDALVEDLRGRAPLIVRSLDSVDALVAEMYCWEVATALAAAVLGEINPFDQPNVQESKDNTARVLESGQTEVPAGVLLTPTAVHDFLDQAQIGDYVSIHAYLTPTSDIDRRLQDLRKSTRDRTHAATTLGYGPRFLHSTGQLHKGGPPSGVFLQLTYTPGEDVDIPGQPYSMGTLYAAQALGDLLSLHRRGLRVARLDLGSSPLTALDALAATA